MAQDKQQLEREERESFFKTVGPNILTGRLERFT